MIKGRQSVRQPKQEPSQILNKIIEQSKTSGRINLSNQNLNQLPANLFNYQPVNDHSFDNQSQTWWEIVDLTRLVAADNSIRDIDERIGELGALAVIDLPLSMANLGNLSILNMKSNELSEFLPELCELPLMELHLGSNCLSELPLNFDKLEKLHTLDLSGNQLVGIVKLKNQSLQNLDLSNNVITEIAGLNDMPLLSSLNISKNKLQDFPSISLQKLCFLDLKHNDFKSWKTVLECPLLKDLCLAFNSISSFKENSVRNCVSLEIFDIRDNNIGSIPEDILFLKNLKRLDITNNSVSTLPPKLAFLKHLAVIHYSGNPLRGLPTSGGTTKLLDYLAKKIPKDEDADISRTSSPEAVEKAYTGDVKNIDWARTGLSTLDFSNFVANSFSPSTIDCSNNQISMIPDSLNAISCQLTSLILSKNKIKLFPALECPKLKYLDLSNNAISSFEAEVLGFPNLDELNLNNNRITRLPDFDMPELSVLLLSDNSLAEISVPLLQKLAKLKTLDLSNNSISMVPPELGLLKLNSLQLMGNTFRVPRAAILQKGTGAVLEYLVSRIPH
ncbi:Leucine-rich repeat-containing protein 40 [Boothiomyces sp. JEL0866]|nr:Leucine-rich repeat-containing protein 40 [Boothiomyces sp. JEL0866]